MEEEKSLRTAYILLRNKGVLWQLIEDFLNKIITGIK